MAPLTPHWHILGAGSIGCLWGYSLSKAGKRVSFIARNPEEQEKLKQALPLRLLKQGKTDSTHAATIGIDQIPQIHNLLICLKTYQTREAIAPLRHKLAPDANLILMQNGMGNHEWLAEQFPEQRIYAAITTEASCWKAPLFTEHTGEGETRLGLMHGSEDIALPSKLSCALPTYMDAEIEAALWQKLVINCCINPLTVIYHCQNGELAHLAEARHQIHAIISEAQQLANALNKGEYLQGITEKVFNVIDKTAHNTSSMRQDALKQQQTEIDAMNGYLIQQAARLGLQLPVNQQIVERIKQPLAD